MKAKPGNFVLPLCWSLSKKEGAWVRRRTSRASFGMNSQLLHRPKVFIIHLVSFLHKPVQFHKTPAPLHTLLPLRRAWEGRHEVEESACAACYWKTLRGCCAEWLLSRVCSWGNFCCQMRREWKLCFQGSVKHNPIYVFKSFVFFSFISMCIIQVNKRKHF